MGILRLLFRTIYGGRSSAPRKRNIVQFDQRLDDTHTQATTIQATSLALAKPTVSAIVGPCWVIDGDTIVISKITIRLFGIDAPEIEHPYGQKAKWALLRLCKGQVVRAVFDGSLSHDRSVATCYLPDGRDLSAEMVKIGMALDWQKFSGGKYRQFEQPGMRRILWRADARQKGRFPPTTKA